jgi:hypothetical protein
MIIKVIHANYAHDMIKTLVASVDTGDITDHDKGLEFAYMKTQNIYDSWSNPAATEDYETNRDGGEMVTVEAQLHDGGQKKFGLRSSMMGDYFQVIDRENYDPDLFYVCAMVGFDPCDPVDYQIMGNPNHPYERFRKTHIIKNPSDHFYRDHAEYEIYDGLDYKESDSRDEWTRSKFNC